MVRRLLKWARLSPRERRQTARAAFTLLRVKASLKASSVRRARQAMALAPEGHGQADLTDARLGVARSLAASIERAAQGLPLSTTCLHRSMALQRLLQREGLGSDLRIGVRRSKEGLEAHAWVEVGGAVLNDTEDVHERYSAFPESVLPSRLELR